MIFRKLGRTNADVGVIGFGCEYLWHTTREETIPVLHEAIEQGINYIDLFVGTPQTRDNFGYALKGKRDKVLLAGHLGCAETNDGQYLKTRDKTICEDYINQFYTRLHTDYIDVLFLHNCDEIEDYNVIFGEDGLYEMAMKLKKEGKARFIGFSTHNTRIALKAINSGNIDVLMFPINPLFDLMPRDVGSLSLFDAKETLSEEEMLAYPTREEVYYACERNNIGLVAMKPYAAGNILKGHKGGGLGSSLLKGMLSLTPVQCLSYVLAQPGVSTVVPGCKNVEEVKAALAYLNAPEEEKDFGEITKSSVWSFKGRCMYCNHCLPCPVKINIAKVTQLKDSAEYELTETLKAQYSALEVKASECLECGACSSRCPFGVDAVKNMQRAKTLFETKP